MAEVQAIPLESLETVSEDAVITCIEDYERWLRELSTVVPWFFRGQFELIQVPGATVPEVVPQGDGVHRITVPYNGVDVGVRLSTNNAIVLTCRGPFTVRPWFGAELGEFSWDFLHEYEREGGEWEDQARSLLPLIAKFILEMDSCIQDASLGGHDHDMLDDAIVEVMPELKPEDRKLLELVVELSEHRDRLLGSKPGGTD